jgi:protein-L-isoaspartate(D-aspartate) O-methyltransferase
MAKVETTVVGTVIIEHEFEDVSAVAVPSGSSQMSRAEAGDPGAPEEHEARAAELRARLVDRLLRERCITRPDVEAAFREVPRHLFTPGASLEEAYADDVVRIKRDENGVTVSSVSAPWLQAMMLEMARVGRGMRCLEIGSGGYNAALMAELVGSSGAVTSIDIDPEVIDRARRCLAAAGCERVRVVLADAEEGMSDGAPYGAVLVTAQAWHIPVAWVDQLADGGRIVVPLRLRGLLRTVAFVRRGDRLDGEHVLVSGFVPMRGSGARARTRLPLGGDQVALVFDDGLPAAPEALAGVLDTVRVDLDSGVVIATNTSLATLQLWLATALDTYCHLDVAPGIASDALPRPMGMGCAAVDGGNLAYLGARKIDDLTRMFTVHAFGPRAAQLAERFAAEIRRWHTDHRGGPGPRVTVYPAATPDHRLPAGRVIDRGDFRMVMSWP